MYNRLFTKIVDSSIWEEPLPTFRIWIMFLALMDKDGFVRFASTEQVARRARLSLKKTAQAILTLESPDLNSGSLENDGKRLEKTPGGWIVIGARDHNNIANAVNMAELQRLRSQYNRDKIHANAQRTHAVPKSTSSDSDSDSDSNVDSDADADANATLAKARVAAAERKEPGTTARSKRPVYQSDRFAIFEWQLDELGRILGDHADGFDLHSFFDLLSQQSRESGLVIPRDNVWAWIQNQVIAEAKRRGLSVLAAPAAPETAGERRERLRKEGQAAFLRGDYDKK